MTYIMSGQDQEQQGATNHTLKGICDYCRRCPDKAAITRLVKRKAAW